MTKKRVICWVAVACFLVLLAEIVRLLIPPTTYRKSTSYYCKKCGMRLRVRESGDVGAAPENREECLKDSPLSVWYREHIDESCEHDCVRSDRGSVRYVSLWGRRLWCSSACAASRASPWLLGLYDDDRTRLEALLVSKGKDVCREHIHKELDRERRRRDAGQEQSVQ